MSSHLQVVEPDAQQLQDQLLEDEIEREHQAMLDCEAAGNRQQARYHAQKVRELVARRSPEQVARMERALGLK